MSRTARIAVVATLLISGTSLATAKNRNGPARTAIPPHPGVNQPTPRPIAPDPYYRLSDSYYGSSDPLRGLFNFYAVPPLTPGYAYGHVKPQQSLGR